MFWGYQSLFFQAGNLLIKGADLNGVMRAPVFITQAAGTAFPDECHPVLLTAPVLFCCHFHSTPCTYFGACTTTGSERMEGSGSEVGYREPTDSVAPIWLYYLTEFWSCGTVGYSSLTKYQPLYKTSRIIILLG